jgi:hypothetical protein
MMLIYFVESGAVNGKSIAQSYAERPILLFRFDRLEIASQVIHLAIEEPIARSEFPPVRLAIEGVRLER